MLRDIRLVAMLENSIFYIFTMYEFSHSLGQTEKTSRRAHVCRNTPDSGRERAVPALPGCAISGREQMQQGAIFAVGTRVTSRPPPRSVRAAFPHTAPTSGVDGSILPYASQRTVSRLSGTEPGACGVGPHSPRSPPLAPPTPQRIAPLCSSASRLLWRGQTSRARTSSATAPHLPDAGRQRQSRSGQTRDLPASDAIPLHVMWP
jgi:hypothetical protein